MDDIIIGQEAICPDGLGRVVGFELKRQIPSHTHTSPSNMYRWIKIDTYVDNRGCHWAPHNVELIDPRR